MATATVLPMPVRNARNAARPVPTGRPVSTVRPVSNEPAGPASSAHRSTARPRTRSARLTPRGRAVLLGGLLALVVLVSWGLALATATASGPSRVVTVQPGDSLWSIAAAVDPSADPRVLVHDIKQRNGLVDSVVTPGQVLFLP